MEFEEQVDDILREAYENIMQEGLERELDDFKKVEDFFASKGSIDDSSSEVWYMSLMVIQIWILSIPRQPLMMMLKLWLSNTKELTEIFL